MILMLSLSPLLATSQEDEYIKALDELYKDSIGTRISLPHLKYWELSRFTDANRNIRVISSEEYYYKLFSATPKEKLPPIDFSAYNLVPRTSCIYCVGICRKYGRDEPCHRQACSYIIWWFLVKRDKQVRSHI